MWQCLWGNSATRIGYDDLIAINFATIFDFDYVVLPTKGYRVEYDIFSFIAFEIFGF